MGIKSFRCDRDTAIVTTTKGKVRGYELDGLTVFKGIPYAKARRFHAPTPCEPWEDVFEATNYGYVCPLLTLDLPNGELLVPHRYWAMGEDCLNLNIWTPATDDKKRPVLFWLHGGGFEAGSAIEHKAYNGANMSRFGDVVVVSVNHRLNLFGYFDLSDFGEEYENSGNAGGDDIIAALRFVKENIESFGGDPENITVFGQSGGGAKVTTLLQTPDADGLFARGINMSGVIGPVLADQKGSGKEFAEALIKDLGLSGVKDLETIDRDYLIKSYNKLRPAFQAEGKYTGGAPHPNAHYAGEPVENGFRTESKDVPLLVGSVFGEFTSFVATQYEKHKMTEAEQLSEIERVLGKEGTDALLPLFRDAYPTRQPIDLLQLDFMFRGPELPYIEKRSALNDATYSYLFNADFPINGGQTPWHCSDIPFVFHNIDRVPYPHGDGFDAEALEEEIFSRVIAFARTGDPNVPGKVTWLPSKPGQENTLIFDRETKTHTNHDHELQPVFQKYMGPIFARRMAEMQGKTQH